MSGGNLPGMSRIQLALNVDDLEQSIAFYTRLFGTEPAKVKPGYANFAVAEPALKLVLIENPGHGGSLNHLGVEVTDTDTVDAEQRRWPRPASPRSTSATPPAATPSRTSSGSRAPPTASSWEIYTVLEDAEVFGDRHPGDHTMIDRTADPAPSAAPSPSTGHSRRSRTGRVRALPGRRRLARPVPGRRPESLREVAATTL